MNLGKDLGTMAPSEAANGRPQGEGRYGVFSSLVGRRSAEIDAGDRHPGTSPNRACACSVDAVGWKGFIVRMRCILQYTALALLLTLGVNCEKTEEEPYVEQTERRIDRLRSLPYVGSVTVPNDDLAGVILHDKERTCQGYRLYTVMMLGRAELITETGDVVRTWQQPGDRWVRAELLPDGSLLVLGMEDLGWRPGKPTRKRIPDSSRYVTKFDWSGKQAWKRKLLTHHDIEVTPDGKLLLLTFERRRDPRFHSTVDTRDDHLTLLDQDGTVVESRSMLDAVRNDPDAFPLEPVRPSDSAGQPWVDLFHANSVEWMHHEHLFSTDDLYSPAKVLVCVRNQDRVAIFDWSENKFVWSWGLNQTSGPHDAQVLKNGHILLFDNGLSRDWSRAIELDPLSGQIVWTYEGNPPSSFYTASKGSVQRLPNGNTLLAESVRGRAIEVTCDGEVVWEFICPHTLGKRKRAAIVRMVHHPVGFVRKLLTAQD